MGSGTDSIKVVPCWPATLPSWWLLKSTQPPTVWARSCRPRMPKERTFSRSVVDKPRPLSLISKDNTPPAKDKSISTLVACACLDTLVSASWAVR